MKLSRWLLENDARLDVVLEAEYDPKAAEPLWRCEIGGTRETKGTRPATFIQTPSGAVTAQAHTPGVAFRAAVRKLGGKQVQVIYRSRNDSLTFPTDLTV